MAWSVGQQLPAELVELFNGEALAGKIGQALLVAVTDEAGWPHLAMVSYGEVVAIDAATLRLGLWDGSRTTRYLRQTGKATLCLAGEHGVFYIKGQVRDLGRALTEPAPIAKLELRVQEVLQDGDPDGEVISGITYRSTETQGQVLERWTRQIAALRE